MEIGEDKANLIVKKQIRGRKEKEEYLKKQIVKK